MRLGLRQTDSECHEDGNNFSNLNQIYTYIQLIIIVLQFAQSCVTQSCVICKLDVVHTLPARIHFAKKRPPKAHRIPITANAMVIIMK